MKKNPFAIAALVACLGAVSVPQASAQELLEGDTRLACEAILCLATGQRPSECTPSLRRYFSISHRKLSDTIKARGNFLKLCPVAQQTPQMASLVNAMANGAGRCDAASLNTTNLIWTGSGGEGGDSTVYVNNVMPDYCGAYMGHAYTDFSGTKPRYVGTPETGGRWVESKDFDQAQAAWEAQQRANQAQQNSNWQP